MLSQWLLRFVRHYAAVENGGSDVRCTRSRICDDVGNLIRLAALQFIPDCVKGSCTTRLIFVRDGRFALQALRFLLRPLGISPHGLVPVSHKDLTAVVGYDEDSDTGLLDRFPDAYVFAVLFPINAWICCIAWVSRPVSGLPGNS